MLIHERPLFALKAICAAVLWQRIEITNMSKRTASLWRYRVCLKKRRVHGDIAVKSQQKIAGVNQPFTFNNFVHFTAFSTSVMRRRAQVKQREWPLHDNTSPRLHGSSFLRSINRRRGLDRNPATYKWKRELFSRLEGIQAGLWSSREGVLAWSRCNSCFNNKGTK